ncbi:MAG TPA: hypothetical protein VJ484_07285 [Lysobacter sp.]|nr:hypothetical protein [Lysobacter sp.]
MAQSSSPHLAAKLEWVIVPGGPGAWVTNAGWDEYLIRVRNTSTAPVRIDGVEVEDSSGQSATPLDSRAALIKASRKTARRYRDEGVKVQAGMGGAALTAWGIGSTTAGLAYSSTLTLGIMGGGSSSAAWGVAAGMVVVGPVLGTMAIVRAARNHKVEKQIQVRRTMLPVTVAPGEEVLLDVFVPIAPSPKAVRIAYHDGEAEGRVEIDTRQVLAGLHLPPPANAQAPAAPETAMPAGQGANP